MSNAISHAIRGTSSSNGVSTPSMGGDSSYNPQQMQDLINKVDEPINALRR
jgi:hypothetical protein